jgi:hypothetical protein
MENARTANSVVTDAAAAGTTDTCRENEDKKKRQNGLWRRTIRFSLIYWKKEKTV